MNRVEIIMIVKMLVCTFQLGRRVDGLTVIFDMEGVTTKMMWRPGKHIRHMCVCARVWRACFVSVRFERPNGHFLLDLCILFCNSYFSWSASSMLDQFVLFWGAITVQKHITGHTAPKMYSKA